MAEPLSVELRASRKHEGESTANCEMQSAHVQLTLSCLKAHAAGRTAMPGISGEESGVRSRGVAVEPRHIIRRWVTRHDAAGAVEAGRMCLDRMWGGSGGRGSRVWLRSCRDASGADYCF